MRPSGVPATTEIVRELGLSLEQVCYIGDDLPDLPAMRVVGLSIAVADAAAELRAAAHYTTQLGGGQGAVREAIEMILKQQNRWPDLVQRYSS